MTVTTLLLVDVQKDFHPGGSLAIPKADQDAERIATLIREYSGSIDRIVATLDTHQKLHIAHPCFWWDSAERRHPNPFTIISAQDIRDGVWKPRSDLQIPNGSLNTSVFGDLGTVQDAETGVFDLTKYCIEYATRLEAAGRFQICVWPEHCLIGSKGHGLVDRVGSAVNEWSQATGRSVEWVLKGQNILTEMYSALAADVPVSNDTAFNAALQASLYNSDRLFVCGQATSHCVNYTLRDIVEHWPKDETYKICLLKDCASAVPGFEEAAATFVSDMEKAGVQVRLSTDNDLF
jgi:nicotinamidase-related amidase